MKCSGTFLAGVTNDEETFLRLECWPTKCMVKYRFRSYTRWYHKEWNSICFSLGFYEL